jgi:hypothetical protein
MLMKVSLEVLIIAGLTFLYLLYKIFELQRKVSKPEKIYYDSSGIHSIKDRQYIDVERNKTLNLRIDKYNISIIHLPWKIALNHIERLAQLWGACHTLAEYEPQNELETKLKSLRFAKFYFEIADHIYKIARPFTKKKLRLKAALMKIAKNDLESLMDITEKIIDYWVPLKKKRQMLAQGGTLRSMVGAQYVWNCLNVDMDGKIAIEPRYIPL